MLMQIASLDRRAKGCFSRPAFGVVAIRYATGSAR
jgi:hypothetical protein